MASIEPPASDPALGLDDSPQGGSEQQEKDHGETNGRPSGWRRVIQDFIPS